MSTTVLWPLEPHTRAKHALLKSYLDRWFPILGKDHSRLNFIDGFAGPGEYEGGEDGSPIIALESAREHVERGTLPQDIEINFTFIEENAAHAAHLRARIGARAWPDGFVATVVDGRFRDHVGAVLDRFEAEKKSLAPTFAFVDPFGFSGIPLSLLARILKFQRCEVLVNVMVDFINRFLEHPNDGVTAHIAETFGTQDIFGVPALQADSRLESVLTLYRRQLKQHAKFVGRFDMHGRRDRKLYSLFFASNAEKGFVKMKEAMWSVDKYTGSKFSSAEQRSSLFEPWDFTPLWDQLRGKFAGKTVDMSEVEQFVNAQTDYLSKHRKSLFDEHEEAQEIEVIPIGSYKRKKGTYPVGKVRIRFVS